MIIYLIIRPCFLSAPKELCLFNVSSHWALEFNSNFSLWSILWIRRKQYLYIQFFRLKTRGNQGCINLREVMECLWREMVPKNEISMFPLQTFCCRHVPPPCTSFLLSEKGIPTSVLLNLGMLRVCAEGGDSWGEELTHSILISRDDCMT